MSSTSWEIRSGTFKSGLLALAMGAAGLGRRLRLRRRSRGPYAGYREICFYGGAGGLCFLRALVPPDNRPLAPGHVAWLRPAGNYPDGFFSSAGPVQEVLALGVHAIGYFLNSK